MGCLLNPVGLRIGHSVNWRDAWYVHRMYYPEFLHKVYYSKSLIYFVFFKLLKYKKSWLLMSHCSFIVFNKKINVSVYLYDSLDRYIYYFYSNRLRKVYWNRIKLISYWLKKTFLDRRSRAKKLVYLCKILRFNFDFSKFDEIRFIPGSRRRLIKHILKLNKKHKRKNRRKKILRKTKNKMKKINFFSEKSKKSNIVFRFFKAYKIYYSRKFNKIFFLKKKFIKKGILKLKKLETIKFLKQLKAKIKLSKRRLKRWKYRKLLIKYLRLCIAIRIFNKGNRIREKDEEKREKIRLIKKNNLKNNNKKRWFAREETITYKNFFFHFANKFNNLNSHTFYKFFKNIYGTRRILRNSRYRYSIRSKRIRRSYYKILFRNKKFYIFLVYLNSLMKFLNPFFSKRNFNRRVIRKIFRYYYHYFYVRHKLTIITKFIEIYFRRLKMYVNIIIFLIYNKNLNALFIARYMALALFNRIFYWNIINPIRRDLRKNMRIKAVIRPKLINLIRLEKKNKHTNKLLNFCSNATNVVRISNNIFKEKILYNNFGIFFKINNIKMKKKFYLWKFRRLKYKINVKIKNLNLDKLRFKELINLNKKKKINLEFLKNNFINKIKNLFKTKKINKYKFIFIYLKKKFLLNNIKISKIKNIYLNKKYLIFYFIYFFYILLIIKYFNKIRNIIFYKYYFILQNNYFYNIYISKKFIIFFKLFNFYKKFRNSFINKIILFNLKKNIKFKKLKFYIFKKNKNIMKINKKIIKIKNFKIVNFLSNINKKILLLSNNKIYLTDLHNKNINKKLFSNNYGFTYNIKNYKKYYKQLKKVSNSCKTKINTTIFLKRNKITLLRQKFKLMEFLDENSSVFYGYKMHFVGRFTRKQRSAHMWFGRGSMPLSTMSAFVDFGLYTVTLRFSACTVRIWLYRNWKAPKYYYKTKLLN